MQVTAAEFYMHAFMYKHVRITVIIIMIISS